MQSAAPPEAEVIGNIIGGLIVAAWIACGVWGAINLKRAGVSPHWMWLSACNPLVGFAIFGISFLLIRNAHVRQQAREEAERAEALRRDEEQRKRQAEERRLAGERNRREAEERQRRAAAEHAAEQRAIVMRLNNLNSDSTAKARSLSTVLRSAEEIIDGAECRFKEGSFVPFWESIEKAATTLLNFDAAVQTLIQNSQFYEKEAARLEATPPPFQLGLDTVPDPLSTHARMDSLVHEAHRNPDFANIYQQRQIYHEQCKTNHLLKWGFLTLGQALSELGDRLRSSLEELATSVNIEISKLGVDITKSHRQITATLSGQIERSRDQAARDAKARAKQAERHAREESEKLDNIQRRRKPLPPGFRDGEY